jgi:hypothetical protein
VTREPRVRIIGAANAPYNQHEPYHELASIRNSQLPGPQELPAVLALQYDDSTEEVAAASDCHSVSGCSTTGDHGRNLLDASGAPSLPPAPSGVTSTLVTTVVLQIPRWVGPLPLLSVTGMHGD